MGLKYKDRIETIETLTVHELNESCKDIIMKY